MTKDEALKLALEALEELDGIDTETECVTFDVGAAITAIKEALALTSTKCEVQPAQVYQDHDDALTIAYQSGYYDGKKAAQPAQEPVAVVSVNQSGAIRMEYLDGSAFDISKHIGQRFYTSPPQSAQEPVADRDAFERHWKKVRGEKKSDRELKRHPLQPQTYIQDSANRHWVTWQAATKKSFPPQRPWVGLTDEEIDTTWKKWIGTERANKSYTLAIEAKLRIKNT